MIWLILATACSASIALIFRHHEGREANRYALISANYLVATVICVGVLLTVGLPGWPAGGAWSELSMVGNQHGQRLSADASVAWAVALGPIGGVLFFISFVFYGIAVRHHGAALAGATAKLGILVPMMLALLLWREMPGLWQWAGIALAVASLLLVNVPQFVARRLGDDEAALTPTTPADVSRRFGGALLLVFVFGGLAEFTTKVFENYRAIDPSLTGQVRYLTVFLAGVFAVALLPSLLGLVAGRRRTRVTRGDLVLGGILGVPNLFSAFFLILALAELPAVVVFPIFGAGTILLISVVERLVWQTTLRRHEQIALVLTIAAVILIGVGG